MEEHKVRNQHQFNYPIDLVYDVIAQLVVDNANHFAKKSQAFTSKELTSISYSYQTPTRSGSVKNTVRVIEVIPNNKIVYITSREAMERYVVSFVLETVEEIYTLLDYGYNLETEVEKNKSSANIMDFFARRKQKQGFKALCAHLEGKCYEEAVKRGLIVE